VADFPVQPSQRDGLGRMCEVHWNQYTTALARDAKTRKAGMIEADAAHLAPIELKPSRTKAKAKPKEPVAAIAEEGAE